MVSFKNIIKSIPLSLVAIENDKFLKPINYNQPMNTSTNQSCSFAHLPKSNSNYKNLDPQCANDIDIIGQEMHVVETGLYSKDYMVITGTVISNIGRTVCLDNLIRYNEHHQVETERTMIKLDDMEHHFALDNGRYSERHVNLRAEETQMTAYYVRQLSPYDCDQYGLQCVNYINQPEALIWCHRSCYDAWEQNGVVANNFRVLGKINDCVKLFDVPSFPTSSDIYFHITHGNHTRNSIVNADLSLKDEDIARVEVKLELTHTRLIEYEGKIYQGNFNDLNSYATADQNLKFAYQCAKKPAYNPYSKIENVWTWNQNLPTLRTANKQINPSETTQLIPYNDPLLFKNIQFNNSMLTAKGGDRVRVKYTFKSYSKIVNVFQVNGAVDDFECYFNGENIKKVESFTCVVTKVKLKGVANLIVYDHNSCVPLYTGHVQAEYNAQMSFPVLKSGADQVMTVCTQLGRCKSFQYTTEKIIINPSAPGQASVTDDTTGFNWDWINNFFATLFHAIWWWWHHGGVVGVLKSIGSCLGIAVVILIAILLTFYIGKFLWFYKKLFKCKEKKKAKKIVDDSVELQEISSKDIVKSVVINL